MLLIRLAPNCVMHHGLGEVLRGVLEGFSTLISRAVLRVFGKSWLSEVGSENSDLFHSGNSEPFGNGRTMDRKTRYRWRNRWNLDCCPPRKRGPSWWGMQVVSPHPGNRTACR